MGGCLGKKRNKKETEHLIMERQCELREEEEQFLVKHANVQHELQEQHIECKEQNEVSENDKDTNSQKNVNQNNPKNQSDKKIVMLAKTDDRNLKDMQYKLPDKTANENAQLEEQQETEIKNKIPHKELQADSNTSNRQENITDVPVKHEQANNENDKDKQNEENRKIKEHLQHDDLEKPETKNDNQSSVNESSNKEPAIEEPSNEINKLKQVIKEKSDIIGEREKELEKNKTTIAQLMQTIDEKNAELVSLHQRIKSIKTGKQGTIQMLRRGSSRLGDLVSTDLIEMLEATLNNKTYKINVIRCSKPSEVVMEYPLLIVCIAVSRVNSDAEDAIMGLTDLSRAVLLIFRQTDSHVSLSQTALTGPPFANLGGILNFAFHEKRGISQCDVNDSSMKQLTTFIRNFRI